MSCLLVEELFAWAAFEDSPLRKVGELREARKRRKETGKWWHWWRFVEGRGLLVWLLVVCVSLPVVMAAAHSPKHQQHVRRQSPEVGKPEEEVSVLEGNVGGRRRESALIKLELKFPSNGQPVGPPRVLHHPAFPDQLQRKRSASKVGKSRPSERPELEQVAQVGQQLLALHQLPEHQQEQQVKEKEEAMGKEHSESQIATNKSQAQLDCHSAQMVLRLNFSQPFKGVVYPDQNRLSPCRFFGDGHLNYELRIPLQGCGSRQSSPRVFVNNVVIRFHRTLELEEDEVKTLICRYPAPLQSAEQLSISPPGSQLFNGSSAHTQIEQENQFELLDPSAIEQHQHRPSLAIDALSDNLVVGPALNHQHQLLQTARPYHTTGAQYNKSAELLAPELMPNWWHNQSSSPNVQVFENNNNNKKTSDNLQSNQASFLDRMSSVELLFLTSSLMFLFLLLMALSIGYCCYKRQAARESARLTTAILNRTGAGFGSPRMAAMVPCGPLSSGHKRLLGSYTGASNTGRWVLPQQQLSSPVNRHQMPPPTSSSPESDQSGRNLLAPLKSAPLGHHNAAFVGSQSQLRPTHATTTSHNKTRTHHRRHTGKAGPAVRSGQSTLGLRSAALYGEPACQLSVPSMDPHYKQPHHRDQLERTKSMLSSVPAFDGSQIYALGGALMGPIRAKQQTTSNYRRRQRRAAHQCENQVKGSSESDPEEANNISSGNPKLILKSIQDSFITNLTEIHSQEYMKRDSMQPLHINKWRLLKRDLLAPPTDSQQPTTGATSQTEPQTEPDPDSGQEQYQSSAHTNLRSLTELDVIFSHKDPETHQQKDTNLFTTSHINSPSMQVDTADHTNRTPSTEPISDQQLAKQSASNQTVNKQIEASHSPDLILSPEYDHSTTSKLELKSPSSPHNSVSYV